MHTEVVESLYKLYRAMCVGGGGGRRNKENMAGKQYDAKSFCIILYHNYIKVKRVLCEVNHMGEHNLTFLTVHHISSAISHKSAANHMRVP